MAGFVGSRRSDSRPIFLSFRTENRSKIRHYSYNLPLGIIKKKRTFMREISNTTSFKGWLFETDIDDNIDKSHFERTHYTVADGGMLELEYMSIDEEDINDKYFSSTKFIKCTFKSCNFKSAT